MNLGVGRTAIEAHDGSDKRNEEIEKRTEIDNNVSTKWLAIRLAAKKPDCTQISASLEHIEGKKEEALAIMRDLETEFDKIKKTEEAEKIGDEADALVDRVDKETNTARSYLAAQVKMS